eukprot:3548515-Prorocentrum_lima.AAC.1
MRFSLSKPLRLLGQRTIWLFSQTLFTPPRHWKPLGLHRCFLSPRSLNCPHNSSPLGSKIPTIWQTG